MKIRTIETQALMHAAQGFPVNALYLDTDAATVLAWIDGYRLKHGEGPSVDVIAAKMGITKIPTKLDPPEEVTNILRSSWIKERMDAITMEAEEMDDPVAASLFLGSEIEKLNTETSDATEVVHQGDFEARAADYRAQVAAGKSTTVGKFGFPTLDAVLHGIEHKDFIVLMARSSSGKSTLSRRICINLKLQNLHVLYITMEEDAEQCARMLDAIIGGVNPGDHVRMKLSPADLDKMIEANRAVAHLGRITVVGDLSTRDVQGVARAILEHKPDIVVLDQITNIVKSTKVEDFTATTRALKQLCRYAPILALIQMSEAGKAKYSESTFQDADKLLKLSDDPKTPTQDKHIFVEKHKKGRRFFEVPLDWEPASGVCGERVAKVSPFVKKKDAAKPDAAPVKDSGWNDEDEWETK